MTADTITPQRQDTDKFEQHYRQQLSALMDGALAPDEARFLLRRLQHDAGLAGCLDRWHMAGDALRGEAQAIVCSDFAERVAAMVAAEPALSAAVGRVPRANHGVLRWAGGAALAASVALVALFVTRLPAAPDAALAPSTIAEASVPSDARSTPVAANVPLAMPVASPAGPTESMPAAIIATASAPVRNRVSRGSVSQSPRAVIRTPARLGQSMDAATATAQSGQATAANVFGTPAVSRPWPSAAFPQAQSAGSFNVDYGSASSPTFYPFAPRLPEDQPREAAPVDEAPAP